MKGHVTKVAVLGSGVMGGTIAAHFANAGIPALVLDIVPDAPPPDGGHAAVGPGDRTVRNRLAEAALARLSGMRPAALFTASRRRLLEAGNLEDDLGRLAEADWVIEVVREEMAIKKKLLAAVVPHLRADALLTSNTSGLSLTEMAESLPTSVRPRFAGTHFFNPPRYMRLLELIPTRFTSSDVVAALAEIASVRLGKGVVLAKDTPNFIANRIGIHSLMATIRVMQESGMTIEQVDALTGKAMARPKTATFRLADLVGVDVLALVADNVRRRTNDESNELFAVPDFLRRMIERGLLGDKSGGGFYKKVGGPDKKILALDLDTLEYRPTVKPAFPELAAALAAGRLDQRLQELVRGPGEAARVAWRIVAPTLVYAASRLGEIADDAETIDRAMRLGYNWALGPFEVWDALGFRATAERLERDGYVTPDWVRALVVSGAESLNRVDGNRVSTPTFEPGRSAPVDRDPRAVSVELLRRAGGELRRNPSASLLDAGDGVLLLEFHSKMNAIDEHTIEMISTAAEEAERNWIALVVANDGESFCAGANLLMLAGLAEAGDWESIERIVRSFQAANDRLERCAVPVVVAPHGIALGGGCEVVLAGHAIRAAAETYLGLVEVGAGLVPAGGGCMRLYRNLLDRTSDRDPYPALETAFRTIGMAKVAGSAEEARELGFLRDGDGSSMNPEHRIAQARVAARALADTGHAPPQ
ncbi:MAG TPA: 3-hydroxyacyl-CoA dehydrogenase NAD-binding domain-containing protein, partial [Candidatus Polarisedimenticolaceae bacterium]|nr:3-hydroxyacyl-CoA dehydrogenase NAD-binding domain-containing protein [Candidatus Polarisedimenticolaceae bacterium]